MPQLWKNERWADQFADFVIDLVGESTAPEVIEIHPPFADYIGMEGFIQAYRVFEKRVSTVFPSVKILIENRCGSVYHGGKFLISKTKDLQALCEQIEKNALRLKIAFDVPQIYTAHNATTEDKYCALLDEAAAYRKYIGGVHLWGKSKSSTGRKVSHCGNLDTYFENNERVKRAFLDHFYECFNDNQARKMVLEVNSGNVDLLSIIADLRSVGVEFI